MKIEIKGPIISNDDRWIYDWFELEATCPNDINNLIDEANGEELEVIINSPGGYVDAGSEIYTNLMSYKGEVTTKIVGIAASIASVIAMAGNLVKISPTAQLMIHNVSEQIYGDYRVFEHESEVLKNYNKSIANAYILKTGMEMEELLELMNAGGSANRGTYLTAQQAKEKGFVDEIMFDNETKLVASINNGMLPREVVNKMKNKLIKDKQEKQNEQNEKEKLLIELDLI